MNAYKPLILFLLLIVLAGVLGETRAQTACEWNQDCISWNYNALGGTPAGIVSHRVETSRAASGPWTTVATVAMPAMAYKRSPVDGTNYYRIVTIYGSGVTSDPSVTASSTAVPPSVTTLQVVENRAYKLDLGYANQLRLIQVGTVPLRSLCKDQTALGMNVVANRQLAVIDAAKSRPLTVLAKCERKA